MWGTGWGGGHNTRLCCVPLGIKVLGSAGRELQSREVAGEQDAST